MKLIEWIKSWFKTEPEPERTFRYGDDDEENQIRDLHIYEDGEFKKTVKLHYFTREQMDKIQGVADEVYDEWDRNQLSNAYKRYNKVWEIERDESTSQFGKSLLWDLHMLKSMTEDEFIEEVKNNEDFAQKWGDVND